MKRVFINFSRKKLILTLSLCFFGIVSYSFIDDFFEITRSLDIMSALFRQVNTDYVDDIDPGKLMKIGIDSMLISLDPYTNYIPESDIEDFMFMTTGQYGGIGAQIRQKGDYGVIVEPYEGFAADKAGLRMGDVILEVDGKSVKGKKTDELSKILKGQPKTSVKLTIKREGEDKPIELTVIREEIKIKNVPFYGMLNDGIGYIKLSGFTDNAGKDVRDALLDLKKNNVKGLVLDLRGNPGGLLNEAVNVTNVFVNKGIEIVTTRGRDKSNEKKYTTSFDAADADIPLAVLVNSQSASASEIVSGSIQDLDRGIIVGQRSFGKGLVQVPKMLSYNARIKVTIAKYYVPSGRCIQALDYSHRNEDGSVGHVPDSLITAFKTKVGRTVYDGGGVLPDVVVEPYRYSAITTSLNGKGYLMDFSVLYRSKHAAIEEAKSFKFSDEDYKDFEAFLSNKNYDYVTKSEKILKDLKSNAEKEKYYEDILKEYEALQGKMMHNKSEDLFHNKEEIQQLLTEQIVQNYYHQKGLIASQVKSDKVLAKAIEVLNDKKNYSHILSNSYVNPKNAKK